jgi:selenocysteine-specific elongation factor
VRESAAAEWPLFELSAHTGVGVQALHDHLLERASAHARREGGGSFRLAIDRVFTMSGVGTIVTGTVHAGRVRVGDELKVAPGDLRARVRSIHAQDRPATEGGAGQRCALNLAGVEKSAIERGQWVQGADLANVADRFDASVHLSSSQNRALGQNAGVHFHHGTADVLARIGVLDGDRLAPGETRLVSIRTDRPLALCTGDRFVLRDAQARRTIGGGVVLDIAPPHRGRRAAARLRVLATIRDRSPRDALAAWLEHESVPLARLRNGWNVETAEALDLATAVGARVAADTAFAAGTWKGLREKLLASVAAAHEREPEMAGVEQNRLRRMVAPALEQETFGELIDELLAEELVVRRGAFVGDPSHKSELGRNERVVWERIKPLLTEKPFEPPRVRDIGRELKLAESDVRTLLRRVARVGEITLVAQDHFFDTGAVRAMAEIARELNERNGAARAAEFRDRIRTGRKVAIQILEFFDRVGYTRRVRDAHVVRRDNPWQLQSSK